MAEPARALDFTPDDPESEVKVTRLTPSGATAEAEVAQLDAQAVHVSLDRAYAIAWRFLAKRDRTVAEMCERLERDRVAPEQIEEVVAELKQHGQLDDARYARRFVEDRRSLDRWGSVRIHQRLLALGVAADLATRATDDDPTNELRRALIVLHHRLPSPPRTASGRQRALELLLRRGFDVELAHDALRAHRAEYEG